MDNMLPIVAGLITVIIIYLLYTYFTTKPEPQPILYVGNNGTVSGDTYCTGGWGSIDGITAKNMKCVSQLDSVTQEELDCKNSYATYDGLRPTDVYCI